MRPSSPSSPTSPRERIAEAARTLAEAGVPTPEVDARLLAAHVLGVAPLEVGFAQPAGDFEARYAEVVRRRAAREPLQHITGSAPFGLLDLAVGPGVFIPRPETELLAEWAVREVGGVDKLQPLVVDLGTGTGALALTVATRCPHARVIAVEKSPAAREYARRNAEVTGARVEIVAGDMTDPQLLSELRGRVDVVVTNPPYVPETGELDPEVYRDPHEAVFSGVDGMREIRGLIPVASGLLAPGGALGIEHDDTTSGAVRSFLLADASLTAVTPLEDLAGRQRFVTASKVTANQPTEDPWPAPSTTA